MDCEDMLDLLRYVSKLKIPTTNTNYKDQKVKWVQEIMIEVTKRLKTPEFLHEMRLLYTLDNWIAFMINANVVYQNIIISSGSPFVTGITEANQ